MPYRESKMQCPRCGGLFDGAWSEREARLECSICHGRFVGFLALQQSHPTLITLLVERPSVVPHSPLGCPLCEDSMRALIVKAARRDVIVDYCGRHGAWFDNGEMEALAASISRGSPPT
jgi:Zn-finger nucleic acid-binding protein